MYKIGQKFVIVKSFGLGEGKSSEHHFVGEHHQITEYEKISRYPIRTKIKIKDSNFLGDRCLFTIKEIEDYFITYEEWMALNREEQIKSVLDG